MDPIMNEESKAALQAEPGMEPAAKPKTVEKTEPREEPRVDPNAEVRTAPRAENPRRRRPKKKTLRLPAFLTHLGQDVRWYYDIRLWSPLILLLLVLALLSGRKPAEKPAETIPEPTIMDTLPEEVTAPTQEVLNPDAVALARMAESVGSGRSENVKTVIMWVAINRSEDRANGYGQSLMDEIARPNQWQGYDSAASYSDDTYAIAKQVLETKAKGGLRPIDSDMLWFVLNDDGSITLRNQFTASANQKWREKTVR